MPVGFRVLLVAALALAVLYKNLAGALQCLWPGALSQRDEPDDEHPPADDPEPIRLTAPALEALGFVRLGVRRERPWLGRALRSYDWVHPAEKSYASMYRLDRKSRRLYFFTPYDGGASVLTADHKRPGNALDGYYLSGGLPHATPDQLWIAHKRQLASMDETGRQRTARGTRADRTLAAKVWRKGAGKREVRLRHLTPACLTALALLMLYVVVAGLPWGHWALLRFH